MTEQTYFLIPTNEWDQRLCEKLKEQNYISIFDDHIDFDEVKHKYYLDGVELKGSSTGFIHSFFGHFDADKAIAKMRKSKNWNANNKYYGLTDDQIKDGWEKNRVESSTLGTRMHQIIEWFCNDIVSKSQIKYAIEAEGRIELKQFLNFYQTEVVAKGWVPFRTELRAFSRLHGLAGSVDMVFLDPKDGKLIIVDWKRSKEIKRENQWQKGKAPLKHMDDCNFSHYSLQLNLYQWFLHEYTDYTVKALYLGVFHPNQCDYQFLAAPVLQHEIKLMLDHRLQEKKQSAKQLIEKAYDALIECNLHHPGLCENQFVLTQLIGAMSLNLVDSDAQQRIEMEQRKCWMPKMKESSDEDEF